MQTALPIKLYYIRIFILIPDVLQNLFEDIQFHSHIESINATAITYMLLNFLYWLYSKIYLKISRLHPLKKEPMLLNIDSHA